MGTEVVGFIFFFIIAVSCTAFVRLFTRRRKVVIAYTAFAIILLTLTLELLFTGSIKTISFEFIGVAGLVSLVAGYLSTVSFRRSSDARNKR